MLETRGLLDTSVLVDLDLIDPRLLPDEGSICAISLAELVAGPLATEDPQEAARRQSRLQYVETRFAALPFGSDAARAYGRVYAAVQGAGRKPRGARAMDLLIAAIAVAEGLPIYTRNPSDFATLSHVVKIIAV